MKALGGAFNQEKALVGAFSVIVQPLVEPMDRFAALIQVGAAYTGVASFHPVTVTSLLALHTYTGPLLVASLPAPHTCGSQLVTVLLLYTLTEMTLFCAISTAMRHHLFVWTVFSPKLLYLGMNLIVYSTISTLLLTVNK